MKVEERDVATKFEPVEKRAGISLNGIQMNRATTRMMPAAIAAVTKWCFTVGVGVG